MTGEDAGAGGAPCPAHPDPPGVRPAGEPLGLATLAAAAASTCIFLPFAPYFAIYAFMVAWLHAACIGLPLYLWLRGTRPPTLAAALVWSFFVGAVPVTLWLASTALEPVPGLDAWSGSVQTVENGRTTAAGWLQILTGGLLPGLLGMLGGGAFRAILLRRPPAAPSASTASPPAGPKGRAVMPRPP